MPYFQQIAAATDPDKVFQYMTNGEVSTAIVVGSAVCHDYTTAATGAAFIIPTTAMLQLPAGIVATASVAAGAAGLVQTKGHCANALVDGTTDVTVGDPLKVANGSVNLTKLASLITNAIGALRMSFVAGETYTTDSAAAKKVYISL